MKTLAVILAFLCMAIPVHAQKQKIDTIPKVNGQYLYQGVANVIGFKKDDLYKNAKIFFANQFKSAINVIQYDDRNDGKIIGKGLFHIETKKTLMLTPLLYKWTVYFTVQIECKDEKYRYTLYDFNIEQSIYDTKSEDMNFDLAYSKAYKGSYHTIFANLINQSSAKFNAIISAINNSMNSKESASSNDF